ncbi:hypothetical protein A9Q84_13200 [Halobacteriovorax marinus]|uniref:Uncharacterized protein n=1 Tax=Halobacteriovorax marinus TaxID=97084 RepID=A0A1Y5F8K9_9BACT|nr:hypothetical protein A9Q84_13200 [Halobacteriovorax marinus]
MKKISLLFAFVICSSTMATDLICKINLNTTNVFTTKVSVEAGEKVTIAAGEQYSFFLKNLVGDDYELEVLNVQAPSRSYALASLSTSSDKLQYSLWSRDILLEASCRIVTK